MILFRSKSIDRDLSLSIIGELTGYDTMHLLNLLKEESPFDCGCFCLKGQFL